MKRSVAMFVDISVLRFAIAQLIANKCREEVDPNNALRLFSEQLHKRIQSGPTPASMQEPMELISTGVDLLIGSAQAALKIK
jgi:hypothetical protein